MQEYKRERNTLDQQLKDMRRKARYHDDHLRIIDQWFKQLIDEVKLMAQVDGDEPVDFSAVPSSLLFADQESFEEHLQNRSNDIRSVMTTIFTKSRQFSPDITDLQSRLSRLLAAEKEHIVELERAVNEKAELETRLENASLRYMMAEKKVDRAKSLTVAKLERQALSGAQKPPDDGGPIKKEESLTNGVIANGEELAELETEVSRITAICEKQKEQIDKLEEENSKLTAQLTELSSKSTTPTDDDYAKTELFKQLKSQYEDLIKKANHLEALNVQLQEETSRLQRERSSYKTQLENETRAAISDKDAQLGQAESNLTRIRNSRDELLADQAIKKASLDQDRDSLEKAKELAQAQEARIQALETENKRLSLNSVAVTVDSSEIQTLVPEDLREKYLALSQKYELLNKELESMSTAFSKSSKLASQKVAEYGSLEEKVVRLSAEKAKADQKYFAAMKNREIREQELRTLKSQNNKSSELFSQLKEAEAASRALISSLEKQLVELKDALATRASEQRASQEQITSQTVEISQLNVRLAELKNLLMAKDADMKTLSSSCRTLEQDAEGLKATLADTKKSLESWRMKGLGGTSEQAEMLRVSLSFSNCPRRYTDSAHRLSHIVTSASGSSKTPSSKLVVILSATTASRND